MPSESGEKKPDVIYAPQAEDEKEYAPPFTVWTFDSMPLDIENNIPVQKETLYGSMEGFNFRQGTQKQAY